MARPESRYVCQACGATGLRWEGQCRSCGAWNSLVETVVRPEARGGRGAGSRGSFSPPVALADVVDMGVQRIPVGIHEVERVLGGGLVPGSVTLLGGEPGIGKSTLVLQLVAGMLRSRGGVPSIGKGDATRVLYASGEESTGQLRLRARRLVLDGDEADRTLAAPDARADDPIARAILVLPETDVDAVVRSADEAQVSLLVVDSIQTATAAGLEGPPGSVGHVREATARLVRYAKETGVPVVIVGHVTKEGSLAGPKTLEHLVDTVLTLDGDRYGPLRLLRASKNRFGATDEVGVFEMSEDGLSEVTDAARAFLGDLHAGAPGSAVAATLEGARPLLVEVQALVAPAGYGQPRRTAAGFDQNRLALLVAVLARRAGIALSGHDIYASITGGLAIDEPALDLPLALALASSARDRPLAESTISCGEVGLLGELRPVRGLGRRLREAERLGFRRAIVPRDEPRRDGIPAGGERSAPRNEAYEAPRGLEVVAVSSLAEAITAALAASGTPSRERVALQDAVRVPVGPGA